jgi:hypothetical protein
MGLVDRLDHARGEFALAGDAQARGGLGRVGGLVAQGLDEPGDAVARFGRAQEDRDDLVLLQVLGELLVDLVRGRDLVFESISSEVLPS